MKVVAFPKCVLPFALAAAGAARADLGGDLDQLVTQGRQAPEELTRSISARIERDPAAAFSVIAARAKKTPLNEQQRIGYVWALGLSKAERGVDLVTELAGGSAPNHLRMTAIQALGHIGTTKAAQALFLQLPANTDPEVRFETLNMLAELQYAPALPQMAEVLERDPDQDYWQPVFVFGKMGDAGVPLLLQKVNDPQHHVRVNAIHVLGAWLMAPQATAVLEDRFWKEPDSEIRQLILSCLERTIADEKALKQFFEAVVAKEKDAALLQFARETLQQSDALRQQVISTYKASKRSDPAAFAREYKRAFDSRGKQCEWDTLAATSNAADEEKLKKLRERILQRNSDEAFYDYRKVNEVISSNRQLAASEAAGQGS